MEKDKKDYRCWLYKQENGKTIGHIFTGQDAVDEALETGVWHTTFADFVDQHDELTEGQKMMAKEVCAYAAGDNNVLANCDQIEDLDMLIQAYERMSQKKLHHKAKQSFKSVRKAIKKYLGEIDGDSTTVN